MWLRQVKHVQLDIPQQELKQKIRKMNGRFQTVVIRYCDELDHFLLGEMQVDQQMPAGHRANGFLKMNNVQPATYPQAVPPLRGSRKQESDLVVRDGCRRGPANGKGRVSSRVSAMLGDVRQAHATTGQGEGLSLTYILNKKEHVNRIGKSRISSY